MVLTYRQMRRACVRVARRAEGNLLAEALKAGGWTRARTARLLDCSDSTLQRALDRHPELARRVVDGRTL